MRAAPALEAAEICPFTNCLQKENKKMIIIPIYKRVDACYNKLNKPENGREEATNGSAREF